MDDQLFIKLRRELSQAELTGLISESKALELINAVYAIELIITTKPKEV
jgi:hypothetical protein